MPSYLVFKKQRDIYMRVIYNQCPFFSLEELRDFRLLMTAIHRIETFTTPTSIRERVYKYHTKIQPHIHLSNHFGFPMRPQPHKNMVILNEKSHGYIKYPNDIKYLLDEFLYILKRGCVVF